MQKDKVGAMGKFGAKALLWLFHGFFLFMLFLIFIGEWTQKIILYPFLYSYKGIVLIIKYVKSIKLELPKAVKIDADSSKNTISEQIIQDDNSEHVDAVHTIKINYELANQEEKNEVIKILPTYENPFKYIHLPRISIKFPNFLSIFKKIQIPTIKVPVKETTVRINTSGYAVGNSLKNWAITVLSFLKRCSSFIAYILGSVFIVSFKSLYTVLKKIIFFIAKIPTYVFYAIKELVYFIYSILKGIVLGVFSFYKYVTSPFFRSFLFGFIFCIAVVLGYQAYLFVSDLPSPQTIGKVNYAQSTHLYDRNGKLLYEIYRDVNRTSINLKELPDYVVQATISIEDKNFYHHHGISFFGGMLRAVRDTWKTSELQGGSTITQQLVKSALLSPERTVERKVKEIVLAVWTEQIYNKDEILEMYLNQVPYGGSAYGIEEAAKVYLGKSAKNLTLSEAALLAGLPQSPTAYSPFVNPKLATQRRDAVLKSMYELGYITKKERDSALLAKANILAPETSIRAPHFVFFTRNELEKEFGMKQVEEGGFRVTTTLDLDIQNQAQQILREELAKVRGLNIGNGGMVVLNPKTGEILAMVGSTDYFSLPNGAFNITTALRQPGSSLKPMLYAMALQHGYTASTPIDDSPIIFNTPGSSPYKPVNYDGRFHGRVTLRYALANSYNIPAVKTLNVMGVSQYVDFARNMGIDTWNDPSRYGLALSLGGGETTLLDIAQVYGVFASGGYRIEPVPFAKIVDSRERNVNFSTSKTPVLDPGISYIISDILADNNARKLAFGPGSALEIPGYKVSVKTGTTDDKKDNLTIGYTPEFLVAVWVGNNDNTPMNQNLVSGITGAAPIWHRMMQYLLTTKSEGAIETEKPADVIAVPCAGRTEYFLIGTERNSYCSGSIIKPKDENKPEARTTSN